MMRAARWIAAVVLANGLSWVYGQQTGDQFALQQKLNSSFKITTLAANYSDIATPGDVVELHKNGMRMSALSAVLTESNTYKDGKIGGGTGKRAWGGFGTIMLQATVAAMDPSGATTVPGGVPPHILAAGDKCRIIAITVQKDGTVFKLFTDPDDSGMRFRRNLKFPLPKLPSTVPTQTAPAPYAAIAPPPDPNTATEIQQQTQQADQSEKEVSAEAGQPGGGE